MRLYDLIIKKRNGLALTGEEIGFIVEGYTRGSIPDYQVSALLMAIWFRGMSEQETLDLTMAMVGSGDTLFLDEIDGIKVDKHSTGGVGDTTTLVVAPLVAATGVPVAKLSGRGLGHTGGTLDKLEAIKGFQTELDLEQFLGAVKKSGLAVAGQTKNLVPADKKLYALRDVTATVDSIPLIAASIMSKKLASGADALVLDVKSGAGAFMKNEEDAFKLARSMVAIGTGAGRRTTALVSSMDEPLGRSVGNALEVAEALETLRGSGPPDLEELCLALAERMLVLAGRTATLDEAKVLLREAIQDGSALARFREMVINQGGDPAMVDNPALLPACAEPVPVMAAEDGFVSRLEAEKIGLASMQLGAGREQKDDIIDPAAGLVLLKKIGDYTLRGEALAMLHPGRGTQKVRLAEALKLVEEAYSLGPAEVKKPALILGAVG